MDRQVIVRASSGGALSYDEVVELVEGGWYIGQWAIVAGWYRLVAATPSTRCRVFSFRLHTYELAADGRRFLAVIL